MDKDVSSVISNYVDTYQLYSTTNSNSGNLYANIAILMAQQKINLYCSQYCKRISERFIYYSLLDTSYIIIRTKILTSTVMEYNEI